MSLAATSVTLIKTLALLPTLGLELILQALPFQCSTSDCVPADPTAQISLAAAAITPVSELLPVPGLGLETQRQKRPHVGGGVAVTVGVGVPWLGAPGSRLSCAATRAGVGPAPPASRLPSIIKARPRTKTAGPTAFRMDSTSCDEE